MRQNLKTFAFMQPLILTQPQGPAWVGDKWAPYLDFLDSLVVRCGLVCWCGVWCRLA